jgi:two-component system, NtrC family, response regulator AtoC
MDRDRGAALIAIEYDEPVTARSRDEKSTLLEADDNRRRRLSLLVIGENYVATHALPDDGDLTIGRSKGVEVLIDVPQISRRHAILHLGTPIKLEDLGSANGTRVRGRQLDSGETVEVAPGDVIELGSTLILLQRRETARRAKRVWSHGTFEGRLEDECSRAEATGQGQFALVRLRAAAPDGVSVPELIAPLVRPGDVLAEYGPDEYELLLLDADAEVAQRSVGQLVLRLQRADIEPRAALALYPTDGRSPEVLMAKACDALGGAAHDEDGPLSLDPAILQLDKLVDRLAAGTINVLLLGETGVGKEVFAEKIHRRSPRANHPLVKLNCAALAEQLLESELFGYEKGAFTGANTSKPGLLETADGGTVFLDELAELPLTLQAKLLRVLEDRAVMRVGATKTRPIDVRFVAATNKDLEAAMADGTFRKDLFFRLSAATLMIPPLRERPAEIAALAKRFITQFAKQLGRPAPALTPVAQKVLDSYDWPGNVRELRNVIERAVLLTGDEPIGPELLPIDKIRATLMSDDASSDLRSRREAYEREVVIDALEKANGNQTVAARILGIARRTLITRIEQYGLPRPRKKS